MNTTHRSRTWTKTALTPLGLALLSACAMGPDYGAFPAADDPVESRVSKGEALFSAESALRGINERSYEMWSTGWSDELRAAIEEGAWLEFNEALLGEYGDYEEILESRVNAAETKGFVRFSFLVQFERSVQMLVHVYPTDGDAIVGIFLRDPQVEE